MKTKELEKSNNTRSSPRSSSTREAVESSIDSSKGDKDRTWEESANKKITRWEEDVTKRHNTTNP